MIGRSQAKSPKPVSANQTQYDPRVWGAKYRGRGPVPLAIVMIVALLALSYMAFTKDIPFTGGGNEVKATFANATTLRASSPVRIAGVNVGQVTSVEAQGDAAEVTMTLRDDALPIHEDATAEIRPRLFLEGNFFVDLHPGSPSAPKMDDLEIPMTQTSTSVQIDEVLAALQGDTREGLKGLLEGYGTALNYQPTAIDDADQEPISRGKTGAQALADSLRYGGDAGKGTAIVNEALLGENEHDLSGLLRAQRDVFGQLSSREADLQGLITAFNVTTGALAAEQDNVQATIRELGPTIEAAEPSLAHLNEALPPLRAYSLALVPGVRELPDLIEASSPWLAAANDLLADDALGDLAKELRRGAPVTASATRIALPLLDELSDLSRCVTDNLDPTFDTPITVDPNVPAASSQPSYLDFLDSAVNTSGAASSFDGNGSYLRVQAGGGGQLLQIPNPSPGGASNNDFLFGSSIESPQGAQPVLPADLQPPEFRTDVDCYKSDPADLNGPVGAVGPAVETSLP
jgi:phospholipid/cholesterol/gamma-HCH transport system substrate-binding protein